MKIRTNSSVSGIQGNAVVHIPGTGYTSLSCNNPIYYFNNVSGNLNNEFLRQYSNTDYWYDMNENRLFANTDIDCTLVLNEIDTSYSGVLIGAGSGLTSWVSDVPEDASGDKAIVLDGVSGYISISL